MIDTHVLHPGGRSVPARSLASDGGAWQGSGRERGCTRSQRDLGGSRWQVDDRREPPGGFSPFLG